MPLAVAGLVLGTITLAVSADVMVAAASRLGGLWRWSPATVGIVVLGFGTSAPELLISGFAAGQGSLDLAVGNILGSNIANLALVLGTVAVVVPVATTQGLLRREGGLAMFTAVIFVLLLPGGASTGKAIGLAVLLAACLGTLIVLGREELEAYGEVGPGPGPGLALGRALAGLIGTLGAAQVIVISARTISEQLGLAEGFVGLSIVAVGTSLPELATALQAARRHQVEMLVGNLLGSNIFNAAAVGSVAMAAGSGQTVAPSLTTVGGATMLVVGLIALLFMATGRRVVRLEGVALLACYALALLTLPR